MARKFLVWSVRRCFCTSEAASLVRLGLRHVFASVLTVATNRPRVLTMDERSQINVPVWRCKYFVKILPTLFAEVLVGTCVFVHDPYAATMLPDLADVAL